MASRQAIGSAGELIAQTRLLLRGWLVGNINTGGMMNAPAIDLLAAKGNKTKRIAVKSTGHGSRDIQWNAEYGWTTLFKGDTRPDFVVFVWFNDPEDVDAVRVFIVPTKVVDRDVKKVQDHWHSNPRRDGLARKRGSHVAVCWVGNDTPGNIAYNFQNKWSRYEENWDQLER